MNEVYAAAWQAKTRGERGRLVGIARRGLKARTPADAALVTWWSWRQLARGPWPAVSIGIAGAIVVVIISVALADDPAQVLRSPGVWAPGFVLYPGIMLAGWRLRQPRLRQAVALNLSVVSGKAYTAPPDDEVIERVLTKATRKLK